MTPGGPRRPGPEIHIHYTRPPDHVTIYRQHLVHEDAGVKVTLARELPFDPPLRIGGALALERGSDAVWFTFPGAWHDIGRFHRADGTLTGIYANVLTPCVFQPGGDWETTDLFLDLWIPAEAWSEASSRTLKPLLLDAEELDAAEAAGHLAAPTAARARAEAHHLMERAARGTWPPRVVDVWTLERARSVSDRG